jgi:Protein of unknown function (DUF1569)
VKNLFDAESARALRARLAALPGNAAPQWGRMTPAQAVAHCALGLEMAVGDRVPPRMLIGRLIGGFIKPKALGDDAPMRRNSPTVPAMVMTDDHDLNAERVRLDALIARFAAGGPAVCTTKPHSFFGPMTPDEWAILMYKHLDHHLRQFGA